MSVTESIFVNLATADGNYGEIPYNELHRNLTWKMWLQANFRS